VYLTPEEERMLAGEEGDLVREAMKFLVKLGESYNAERMIDISCYRPHCLNGSRPD